LWEIAPALSRRVDVSRVHEDRPESLYALWLPGMQMTMPPAAEFEQVGPKKQVEFRIYLVSKGRSVPQTSKDQQKCASAPHFRPNDFSLQAYVMLERTSITKRDTPCGENQEGRGQIRMRRERPHPLTHRASRLLWGRSRLSHAQRVTHLAASQSRSFGVVRQRPLHPVREKVRTRIKAPAIQPKAATFAGS
jgi:hypothetical protein